MPTPFTHLAMAQRLLNENRLSDSVLTTLNTYRPAFLLGIVAADARVSSAVKREVTHFYAYDSPLDEHPWQVMFEQHPTLETSYDPAHRAFLAGYVAHLATDESWVLNFVRPHIVRPDWGDKTRAEKFRALHLVLIHMDNRDLHRIEDWQAPTLSQANPTNWLPFLPDSDLATWRDYIAGQIEAEGESKTLEILSERIDVPIEELRSQIESPAIMHEHLWQFVTMEAHHQAEEAVYDFTVEQMQCYWNDYT